MRFQVVGPLTVEGEHGPAALGGPKVQHLLARLLVDSPHPVPTEALVEELWGDSPPATAAHIISTYASTLRAELGGRVESTSAGYRMLLRDGDRFDARALREAVRDARSCLAADPARALAVLEPVADTWSKVVRPFEGVDEPSASLETDAARLAETQTAAAALAAEALMQLGRASEAAAVLLAPVSAHPYDERLVSSRMRALYRAGRQGEALAAFRQLRSRLVAELGVEPGAPLRALRDQILTQDPGLLPAPPHRLPPRPPLVGRSGELAQLRGLLTTGRLVTLHGPGGIGKSALATAAAHENLTAFPGGSWFVDLGSCEDPRGAMRHVQSALDIPGTPDVDPRESVAAYLAGRRALLVLDTCEHLLPDLASDVDSLRAREPDVSVLATSRTPLNVDGEHLLSVGPLSTTSARRLFLDSLRQSATRSVTPREADRACDLVDRVPLAIEIAAASSGRGTASAVEPSRGQPLGAAADSAWSGSESAMTATIERGYRLLGDVERDVFDRVSVLSGPFVAATAAALVDDSRRGDVPDALRALEASSMIAEAPAVGGVPHYRLLQPLREFGSRHLLDRGLDEETRSRHARHFLSLAVAAGGERLTPAFAEWTTRLREVEPDLSAAIDWTLGHLGPGGVAGAAPGLFEYWFRRGDPASAYDFGTRVLATGAPMTPEDEAAVRLCAGFGGVFVGDVDAATRRLDEAIDMVAASRDWRVQVWAALGRGQNATVFGDHDTAARMGRLVLATCDRWGLTLPRAYGYALRGEAEFLGGGDLARARRDIELAIEGFRALEDPASLNLFGLGIAAAICVQQGDLDRAEEYATEAATLPGPGWRATALIILGGWVLHARGERERAERLVLSGAQQARALSLEPWARHGCLMLARLAADRDDWERAAYLFGAAQPQPPWGQAPHWWARVEDAVDALGEERSRELMAAGSRASLVDVLGSE